VADVTATVYFADNNESVTVTYTFTVGGVLTNGTVVVTVADPTAATSTPAVTNPSTGKYVVTVTTPTAGTWNAEAVATGASFDAPVQVATFTVADPILSKLYATPAELKSRIGMAATDTSDDFEILLACQGATAAVEELCRRYFWRGTDTRTYVPKSMYGQQVDDIVSVTALNVDFDGDGTFEQAWTQNTDYALTVAPQAYNKAALGEQWPFTGFQVIGTGKFIPFVWPWSHQDRIQIIGTFGWPAVPRAVKTATLIAAASVFRRKDAPFGIAGFGEFALRIQQDPMITQMLARYISGDRVGV
jgi:hypothetical protein